MKSINPKSKLKLVLEAFDLGQYEKMISLASEGLGQCGPGDEKVRMELLKLRGIANASIDEFDQAFLDFRAALKLDPTDDVTIANYFTLCFDSGKPSAALQDLSILYGTLSKKGKSIVRESVMEAVRTSLIQIEKVPPEILNDATKDLMSIETDDCDPSPVQYVDEDGNPINPVDIDPEKMDFEDEFGRQCNSVGTPLDTIVSEEQAVKIAEKLIAARKVKAAIAHCKKYMDIYSESSKLWKILANAQES